PTPASVSSVRCRNPAITAALIRSPDGSPARIKSDSASAGIERQPDDRDAELGGQTLDGGTIDDDGAPSLDHDCPNPGGGGVAQRVRSDGRPVDHSSLLRLQR